MYRYTEFDQSFLAERNRQFRAQVERRIKSQLTEEEFKPLRLMNGLYLQLHAYMLRVAIPYGSLDPSKLRQLAYLAERWDKGYGHFTTRTNIQYNWPRLRDVPDMLDALAEVGMHAIQTSGNTIRNVTSDHFAGAAADEIDDPRPVAELIRQWSTDHPEFQFLPRKFKIAVTGSPHDRAAVKVHDIGLILDRNDAGEPVFEVIVGGGLGRTPFVGKSIRTDLPTHELLGYLEAILRVYNRYGRRDNKYKARIKILVEALGPEAFTREVEAEYERLRGGVLRTPREEIDRIAAFFPEPEPDPRPAARAADPAFDVWAARCLRPHKVAGLASVIVSLKPRGKSPGDMTADQMDALADLADRYARGEIRVTKEQNLVLPHVARADAAALWEGLRSAGLAHANAGLASDIVSCPGLDYCNLANARSIPLAEAISERLHETGLDAPAGELTIKISGCINACGHHHVANIGLLGVDKRGEEVYQLTLGGVADGEAEIGRILGPALSAGAAVDAVERTLRAYIRLRREGEPFIATLTREGFEPFKEAVYAH